MLEGEVLCEKLGAETWVHAFSVTDLPLAPAERFATLFRERAKWEWKDLQPYIRYDDLHKSLISLLFCWLGLALIRTRLMFPLCPGTCMF
jgi:hypothetical protein